MDFIMDEEKIRKVAKSFGVNGVHVTLPKELNGKRVIVLVEEEINAKWELPEHYLEELKAMIKKHPFPERYKAQKRRESLQAIERVQKNKERFNLGDLRQALGLLYFKKGSKEGQLVDKFEKYYKLYD